MKFLIWLGGFITGATTMLAVVLWVLQDSEVIPASQLVTVNTESPSGSYEVRGRLVRYG